MDQTLSKPGTDLLDFWKSRQDELPLLSAMARDFLPIQSSSVAVERDFSSGVDVVTPNRHRLVAKNYTDKNVPKVMVQNVVLQTDRQNFVILLC